MGGRQRTLIYSLFFIWHPLGYGFEWVADALPTHAISLRSGYEYLHQPDHPNRIFSGIHTIQVDVQRAWPEVRLFIHHMGYHIAHKDRDFNHRDKSHFWDDLRVGGQFQSAVLASVHWGIRFWTKLPNTSDETELGTDETDFLTVFVLSIETSSWLFVHLNAGLAIMSEPRTKEDARAVEERMASIPPQDDLFYGGLRLTAVMTSLKCSLEVHGFSGTRIFDKKLTAIASVIYSFGMLAVGLELQAALSSNYRDRFDPFDHTAYGGKVFLELQFLDQI